LFENTINAVYNERKHLEGFKQTLYKQWKDPLDLLEQLIVFSIQCGEIQLEEFLRNNTMNNKKHYALLKIHARAILISKEIFSLLQSGYADGANARWRSLHELTVIFKFLVMNEENVSERYLIHEFIKFYKDLKDYNKYHEKIGYEPYSEQELNHYEKRYNELLTTYPNFDYERGYGWIPKDILKSREFRKLEEYVNLGHWRPYYNMALDAVHGGSKGFDYIGIPEKALEEILFMAHHIMD
jgi:hypothetical protein